MSAAALGFIGILIGLAVGRGYGFWSGRRSELAEAAVAAAVLSEELTAMQGSDPVASSESLERAWEEHRRWLVIHVSPLDFKLLSGAVAGSAEGADPFGLTSLTNRMEALHRLFWEEHEAFILVPLVHYLKGDTVSKRIREILDPARDADTLATAPVSTAVRSWHSPTA